MGTFSALGSIAGAYFGPIGSAVGGALGSAIDGSQEKNAAEFASGQEYARQQEFARMGIRWRVADAKAAGLHPLAALGTQGASYSPVLALPGGGLSDPLESSLQSMGQNVNRAKSATQTDTERRLEAAAIRNAELRNSLLEMQILDAYTGLNQPRNPPAPDAVGVASGPVAPTGAVRVRPSEVISAKPNEPHVEAGVGPGMQDVRIGGGATIRIPNQQLSDQLENMGPGVPAYVTGISALRDWWHGAEPPKAALPKGYVWKWNRWKQAFEPYKPPAFQPRRDGRSARIPRSGASGSW